MTTAGMTKETMERLLTIGRTPSQSEEIASLRQQLAEAQRENAELRNAIDQEMVTTHLGVFNRGDDPVKAIRELMLWSQGVGQYFAMESLGDWVHERMQQADADYHDHGDDTAEVYATLKMVLSKIETMIESLPLINDFNQGEKE